MKPISEHISYAEGIQSNTAIKRGIPNNPNETQLKAMRNLAKKVFEPLRKAMGDKPIRINSFFRSPNLNKIIGGSTTSQHCKGEAMDIKGLYCTNKEMFDYIKDNLVFDQLIWEFGTDNEPAWVHVSIKLTGKNRKNVIRAKKVGRKTVYVPYK